MNRKRKQLAVKYEGVELDETFVMNQIHLSKIQY